MATRLGGAKVSKHIAKIVTAMIGVLLFVLASRTEVSATDVQGAVRSLEDGFARAVRDKDLDKIMSYYTVSDRLVVFDVIPPNPVHRLESLQGKLAELSSSVQRQPKLRDQ